MFRRDGKVAIVTGAATGLGQAIAVALASNEAGMVNCHTLCVDGGWTAC